MTSVSQDVRVGGDRGYRLGAGDPWAARIERMAAALAYRQTDDPFGPTSGPAPVAEPAAAAHRPARDGHRLWAAVGLVFARIRLG